MISRHGGANRVLKYGLRVINTQRKKMTIYIGFSQIFIIKIRTFPAFDSEIDDVLPPVDLCKLGARTLILEVGLSPFTSSISSF